MWNKWVGRTVWTFVLFSYQHNSWYAWFCVSNPIRQKMHCWYIYFIFWALAMLYVEVPSLLDEDGISSIHQNVGTALTYVMVKTQKLK
jgi:hypothetical protein